VSGSLLVGLGRSVVLLLLGLVRDGVASGLETGKYVSNCEEQLRRIRHLPVTNANVAVLGDLLVSLLGSTMGGALDLVGDVVAGVLDGVHDG